MSSPTSSPLLAMTGKGLMKKETFATSSWYNDTTTISTTFHDAYRTGNGSTEAEEPPEIVQLAAYFVPIFFGAMICIGLTGNSLVITVMTKLYKLHGQRLNNTNRFILNLAFSDLLFLIFCVPFHAVVYTLQGWVFGGFFCVFSKYCEEMTKIASVYTLVALSVDRFLAVVYATSARQIRTKANAIRGLIFIWTAAASIAVPVVFTRTYMKFKGNNLCILNPNSASWSKWYELSLTVFGYVLPLSVIICCYVGLLRVMCITAKNSSITVSNSSNDSRKKVTRIVILVVIVFAICWMPNHLIGLWIQFDPNFNFESEFTFAFRLVAHCMAYANSSLNPLIYAFVSKKFRQDFKKAFTCQYLTEAVGSVKEFSRRMIGTVRDSLSGSSGSRNNDVRNSKSSKSKGGASKAIEKNQKFCPRSPLTPLGSIPRSVTELDTTFVLVDMKTSPELKHSPQVTSLRNSEQDLLLDENGSLFDDGSPYKRDQV